MLENSLRLAVSSGDVQRQIKLDTQILDLKNKVDSSLPIKEYLLDYKYSQLRSMTESGDPATDQLIEKEIAKRMKEIKERLFEVADK